MHAQPLPSKTTPSLFMPSFLFFLCSNLFSLERVWDFVKERKVPLRGEVWRLKLVNEEVQMSRCSSTEAESTGEILLFLSVQLCWGSCIAPGVPPAPIIETTWSQPRVPLWPFGNMVGMLASYVCLFWKSKNIETICREWTEKTEHLRWELPFKWLLALVRSLRPGP